MSGETLAARIDVSESADSHQQASQSPTISCLRRLGHWCPRRVDQVAAGSPHDGDPTLTQWGGGLLSKIPKLPRDTRGPFVALRTGMLATDA